MHSQKIGLCSKPLDAPTLIWGLMVFHVKNLKEAK